jgi:hypothetical protein
MKSKDRDQLSEGEDEEDDDITNKAKRRHVECIMGDYTEEQLRNMHPQRSTYNFTMGKQNQIVITSDFDAGNMARCEQMDSGNHVSNNSP